MQQKLFVLGEGTLFYYYYHNWFLCFIIIVTAVLVIVIIAKLGDVNLDAALKLGCQAPHLLLFIVPKLSGAPKSTTFLSRCMFEISTQ
jgi:hypothetical protein